MIICTGTSKRHVSSIADHVANEAKKSGFEPLGMDGKTKVNGLLSIWGQPWYTSCRKNTRNVPTRKTLELMVKIQLIAVGTKMPKWVEEGFQEYRPRFPTTCHLS